MAGPVAALWWVVRGHCEDSARIRRLGPASHPATGVHLHHTGLKGRRSRGAFVTERTQVQGVLVYRKGSFVDVVPLMSHESELCNL